MQHQFSITTALGKDRDGHQLRSQSMIYQAETELGATPQVSTPERITGRLLGLSQTEVLKLATSKEAEAGFEGYSYRFIRLDPDGSFTLTRISGEQ